MMDILIIAASTLEISPLLKHLSQYRVDHGANRYKTALGNTWILITGIGGVAAAWSVSRFLAKKPVNLAIQAGIAGSFSRDTPLGSLLRVSSEVMADMGVENNDRFMDLFETGLEEANQFPYRQKKLYASDTGIGMIDKLPEAKGISVNTVSGNSFTINRLMEKYDPQVESMEGAAFHYVCLMEKMKFVQIRSISNYVEVRDKSKWNIPLAVKNLNDFLIRLLDEKVY